MNQPLRRQISKIQLQSSLNQTSSILRRIKHSNQVKQCHATFITSGLSADDVFASNNLINAYAAANLFKLAEAVFNRLACKNVVSWTILISGYVKVGCFIQSVDLFRDMVMSGLKPNAVTISSVVPAFGNLGLSLIGKSVHCYWIRVGFESNVFVETALVDMYGKLGLVDVARKVFDEMAERNVVSWNAIISGYSDNGFGLEAMWLFKLMRRIGFRVDCCTIMSLVSACSSVFDARIGDGVHGFVIRAGLENAPLAKTSMLKFYVSVLKIEEAYIVFNEISEKDVVVRTLMLNGLVEGGYYRKATEHFTEMLCVDDVKLDSVVYIAILSSCRDLGALMQGRRIHAMIIKTGFECHVYVGSSLIDMYSNCGQLEGSRKIFEGVEKKDVVCWNTMIRGFGMNGLGGEALDLFCQMGSSSLCPDDSTLVQILSACSHAGMVSEGLEIFNHAVSERGMVLKPEHYACVVDLLCRAGKLSDALLLIQGMPVKPSSCVYGALFGACRTHEDLNLGVETAKQLFDSEPADPGFYLCLLNILSQVGNWDDIDKVRTLLKSKALFKDPGFSSIELNNKVHTFIAGATECPPFSNIDNVLKALAMQS
ncbi:unnamed protein product [Rhodiola kirilowii]